MAAKQETQKGNKTEATNKQQQTRWRPNHIVDDGCYYYQLLELPKTNIHLPKASPSPRKRFHDIMNKLNIGREGWLTSIDRNNCGHLALA